MGTYAFGVLPKIYALTSVNLPILPIVLDSRNLGYALAVEMTLLMGLSNALYFILRRRAERWQK